MVRRYSSSRLAIVLVATFAAGACGSKLKTHAPVASRAASPPPVYLASTAATAKPATLTDDPVLTLIAASDGHFKTGQREHELGHLDAAKQEFDRAVSVLRESPYRARTEPRIREYFDRLVERVSVYEAKALAEGDGFVEKKYTSASIDELLELSAKLGTPVAGDQLKNTVQTDLARTGHDIDIPLNQRVLSYVELFQGRLHDFIEEGMKRGSKYLPMIQNVFRAEGLPLDLAYIPLIESAFNPNALSRAKAKGVWQFMSGTAGENGLRRDWYIDERSDPAKATVAAAKYLKTLANLFSGDWHLALASYNGGPGRLQRAVKRVGVDDFWALAAKPDVLPRETREYVPMILAAIVIARNPAQYGFDIVPGLPAAYEEVTILHPVDLRRVAEWAGTTTSEIQALNPELRRWTTPVKDAQYDLKVPVGTADRITARLQAAPNLELTSLKWYTVTKGDTLGGIAKKLNVARTDLAEANYLTITAGVNVGQKLIVPREAALRAVQTERPVPAVDARRTANPPGDALQSGANANRVKVSYEVQEGDTLSSIARVFKTTIASLQTWNQIDGDRISAGDRLTIYTSRAVQAD